MQLCKDCKHVIFGDYNDDEGRYFYAKCGQSGKISCISGGRLKGDLKFCDNIRKNLDDCKDYEEKKSE